MKAYRAEGGRIVFSPREGWSDRPLELACGQCIGCRMERSRQWAIRCVHEAQLHEQNCFVTLTYRPEDLPVDGSLDVSHWQKFAKRLRKRVGPFRFLHVGEYGEENFRPHYHACIFGQDFSDDRELLQRPKGHDLFVSPALDASWGKGFSTIGAMNWQTASYVSRYCVKRVTGAPAKEKYRRIDLSTGEEYFVKAEYITMSRRPGLGADWYARFKDDVFPDDFVVHEGKKFRTPRFYDGILEREEPQVLESMKRKRIDAAFLRRENCTPERLRTREYILGDRLSRLERMI